MTRYERGLVMKAKCTIGQGSGGKRTILENVLPLDTPFGIDVFPIHACNFQCSYCLFALDIKEHGFGFKRDIMDYSLYKKCVDDIKQFSRKIKMIRFVGIGEPLLHKEIDKMVRYTVENNVAEQTEIITNGTLLTENLSDRLISAGLGKLLISIQGLSKEDYKRVSNYDIDMAGFINNIKYFYYNRQNTKLGIKIIDCGLNGREDEFFGLFGDLCDNISIEHTSPLVSKIDYTNMLNKDDLNISVRGGVKTFSNRCSFPFYLLQINPDGTVYPCCSAEKLESLGNCNTDNIVDIWHGEAFNKFRKNMLKGAMYCGTACANCEGYRYASFKEDIISDEKAKELLGKY